jgi:predicted O-methyltransferase YrrM
MRFLKRVAGFLHRYLYALVSSVYLFTLGLAKRRHRNFIHSVAHHFGYVQIKTTLPSVSVEALTDDDALIQLRRPISLDGNVNLLEMLTLVKLARRHGCRRLMEVGTFDGRTALNLAANTPPDAQVFTLDLPQAGLGDAQLPLAANEQHYIKKDVSGARYQGTDCAGKIVQLYGDSATFDFSPYFGTMDFVFIDASHSYEYVLSDSRVARKLLGPGGGVLLWHDYGFWEGVTRALDELAGQEADFRGLQQIAGTSLACLIVGAEAP